MLKAPRATIRQGKIEFLEATELPGGAQVLVTFLLDEESDFWLKASQSSLDAVWDNPEDDIYAERLEKSLQGWLGFSGTS